VKVHKATLPAALVAGSLLLAPSAAHADPAQPSPGASTTDPLGSLDRLVRQVVTSEVEVPTLDVDRSPTIGDVPVGAPVLPDAAGGGSRGVDRGDEQPGPLEQVDAVSNVLTGQSKTVRGVALAPSQALFGSSAEPDVPAPAMDALATGVPFG
jgi:hypothetical protein